MPWYQYIDDDMDVCDPESYTLLDKAPESEDGPFLKAIFADELPGNPAKPDLDGTPGLLYYIIRAYKTGIGQPYSVVPPVPLEVIMSQSKAKSSV